MIFRAVLIGLIALSAALPILIRAAAAQTVYLQPISSFAWPTHDIPVRFLNQSAHAHSVVLAAMATWNNAQRWFIKNILNDSSAQYSLSETTGSLPSEINIQFNENGTGGDWGYTAFNYSQDSQGVFTRVVATINLDLNVDGAPLPDDQFQALASHELGHALGLDHTGFSKYDLMNHLAAGYIVLRPSTLNLYAVDLLSRANSSSTLPTNPVTLPTKIPYGEYPVPTTVTCGTLQACLITTNAILSNVNPLNNGFHFNLAAPAGMTAYSSLTIPKSLMPNTDNIKILANQSQIPVSDLKTSDNATHYFVNLTNTFHSIYLIDVIFVSAQAPRLNALLVIPAVALASLIVLFIANGRRKQAKESTDFDRG